MPRRSPKSRKPRLRPLRWLVRVWVWATLVLCGWVAVYGQAMPGWTPYMRLEATRHDDLRQDWVPLERIAPIMMRAVVAAEDANFCRHGGFDMTAIRAALAEGGRVGASTLTQQTVKNVFLWQGRNWPRKMLEAALTPAVELFWTKRRILEVYLNIAEFDGGVFGVEAAAQWYFGTTAAGLTPAQAAALAVVLPNPKGRSAIRPTPDLVNRAAQVLDGARTLARDGRDACFVSMGG